MTFLDKARAAHGDRYDYSQAVYVDSHTPVKIICPEHGVFEQRPHAHVSRTQKQGCPKCGLANRKHPGRKTSEGFIVEARAKWGDRYDYASTRYVSKVTKVSYGCPECGTVEQMPTLHLRTGCPHCAGRGIGKHTVNTFIAKARKIHGDRYGYDQVAFSSIHDKVVITCPQHGDFPQKASSHLNAKSGCPRCQGGVAIDRTYVDSEGDGFIPFLQENHDGVVLVHRDSRGITATIRLARFAARVEFQDNLKHTECVIGRQYCSGITNLADRKGIRLIQVFGHEWDFKREVVKSRLRSLLNRNEVIQARKTEVVGLSSADKNVFLDRCHIQGKDSSSIYHGLRAGGRVVACMTFGRPRFGGGYDYELMRYASSLGTNVVGGAGKLLAHFRRGHPGSIVSYADRRWSTGDLYRALGFVLGGVTSPGYVYYNIKTREVRSRVAFQRHRLAKMPVYDPALSEYEIMKANGWDRIWNAGNTRWVMADG